jgi:hypothetical protein
VTEDCPRTNISLGLSMALQRAHAAERLQFQQAFSCWCSAPGLVVLLSDLVYEMRGNFLGCDTASLLSGAQFVRALSHWLINIICLWGCSHWTGSAGVCGFD